MKLIVQVSLGVFFGGMMLLAAVTLMAGSMNTNRQIEALASEGSSRP